MKPTMLKYRYRGEPLYVGKVLYDSEWFCRHEESGSQELRKYTSPGGVDADVALYLYQEGVLLWQHYNSRRRTLYTAGIEAILRHGIEQVWAGRDRLFLPGNAWQELVGVSIDPSKPWVTDEKVIEPDDIDPATRELFLKPSQGSLL